MGLLSFLGLTSDTGTPTSEPGSMLLGSSSQIQNGETTAPIAQFDADSVTIVGASGTAAEVANGALSTSAKVVGSANSFFSDPAATALTTAWQNFTFGFTSVSILVSNDGIAGDRYIEYSFDGSTVHGRILGGEVRVMDLRSQPGIYLRGEAGAELYRLEAY